MWKTMVNFNYNKKLIIMETLQTLESMSLSEIRGLMVDQFPGNAGIIINGFVEMGLTGEKLKAALIRYIKKHI
jgi:hypothetical protein